MTIRNQIPPAGALRALDTIPDMIHPKDLPLHDAIADVQAHPENHAPHSIWTVGLEDLAGEKGLRGARHIGWRFLTDTSDGRRFSVEVHADPNDSAHEFGMLNQGPFIEATESTLAGLQNEPLVKNGVYTVSLLRIPPLYVVALWLRGESGNEDRIVPMPPVGGELTAGRLYFVDEFHNALRESAKQRSLFDDRK